MKEEIRYSNPTALTNSQDYRCLITSLKQRYLSARLKAAQSVSRELLQFYWSVGHDIYERQWENTYGSAFYKTLSRDLRRELPDVKGLSEINLRYMTQFYSMYSQVITILPQVAEEFKASIGLLICRDKDNVLARYALENISAPIGISEYQLSQLYPKDYKSSIPSIEEIEKDLNSQL